MAKKERGEIEDEPLDRRFSMAISKSDQDLLGEVAGAVSMSAVARAAMRFGLEAFARDRKLFDKNVRAARPGPKPRGR